jgi:hypothetical protein
MLGFDTHGVDGNNIGVFEGGGNARFLNKALDRFLIANFIQQQLFDGNPPVEDAILRLKYGGKASLAEGTDNLVLKQLLAGS